MKKQVFKENKLVEQLNRFVQKQDGVYSIMMAGMGATLLAIIAFAVDGSGIILDQARLSDSLEQASLAITAENNENRTDKYQINDPKGRGESFNQSLRQKRNEELVESYVRGYMPQIKSWTPKEIKCIQKLVQDDKNVEQEIVQCYVSGSIKRNALLPTFLDTASAGDQSTFSEGLAFKIKENPPLDVMIAADFSGSMAYRINDPHGSGQWGAADSKSNVLKSVLNELTKDYLFKDPKTLNRIGFTAFSFGAKHPNINGQIPYGNSAFEQDTKAALRDFGINLNNMEENCVLPYQFKQNKRTVNVNLDSSGSQNVNLIKFLTEQAPSEPWWELNQAFASSVDVKATIDRIKQFDGSARHYSVIFKIKRIWGGNTARCVGYNWKRGSYQHAASYWFDQSKQGDFSDFINKIEPEGATLVNSGLLVATNLMMDRSQHRNPDDINMNTRRTLIVLSDGRDQLLTTRDYNRTTPEQRKYEDELRGLTGKFIDEGVCDAIRERIDSIQNPKYTRYKTKIVFIAFGYNPGLTNEKAWKKCVGGDDNYFVAHDRKALLDSFKKAFESDGVGKSLVRPKF